MAVETGEYIHRFVPQELYRLRMVQMLQLHSRKLLLLGLLGELIEIRL